MSERMQYGAAPIGQHFGRWTVVGETVYKGVIAFWPSRCECGVKRLVQCTNITNKISRSCGCWKNERTKQRETTHGATHVGKKWPEYMIWAEMIQRCTNSKHPKYLYYGGRGIRVADEFTTFQGFIDHVGRRPESTNRLDRIDNDGHYEPGNLRWTTARESRMNQRRMK